METLLVKHPLYRAHFKIRSAKDFMRGIFDDAYTIFFSDLFFKCICCGCSFEMPQLAEAIQMSTNNICFYKEV